MGRRFAARVAAAAAFVAAIAAPRGAQATETFPADVQTHYGLHAVPVDPPNGCQLCHQSDIGGDPTTLRPFGRLLYTQLGVQPYNDDSLRAALAQLDTQYTNLADDIATGKDPNVDLSGGEGGITNPDPVPMYGCAVGVGARSDLGSVPAMLGAFAVFMYRARRKIGRRPTRP
jgi:hypothetical protein